ncbi:microsomal triacylglycerol transfer protein isoform X2 [Episyrphus balteatus]|uniref:microsomal triacylglycerol transfer protein isoform X2 n=1 Tax=Episyrphus balteatus TaxID=286459 RepID=UPI002486C53C|nr:microsomal triacylglycerol transfer protein isoform X2 [Episyrphus balteatus]
MEQFGWYSRGFLVICLLQIGFIAPSQQQLIPYGTQQFFEYQNKVSVTDLHNLNSKDTISYTLTLTATVRSIWHRDTTQLLLITLHKPKIRTSNEQQNVPKIIDKPYYVVVEDGKVIELLADRSRDAYLLNLRRSIASFFNFHYENGPVPEIDVSGECIAFYLAKSSTKYEKIKSDCSNWDLKVTYRSELPLEVSLPSGVDMKPSLKIEYDLAQDGSLLKLRSHESHSIALHAKPDAGSRVESEIILKHVAGSAVGQLKFDTLNDTISSLEDFRAYEMPAEVDGQTSEIKGITLAGEISAHKNELTEENIGKESTALLLVKLLPLARITNTEEIIKILEAHKSIRSQIIDLLGATQTIHAHNAFFKVFNMENKENVDIIEKYLQALSVGTHPDRAIIEDLFAKINGQTIEDSKLKDTLIQTTASLARQSTFGEGDELVSKIRKYLLNELTIKCTSTECKTQYIRALQNLQDITTVPVLLKLATEGDVKVSVTSLQALRSFPIKYFSNEDSKIFESIFFQTKKKYDSSARTLALDIILDMKPNKEQLGQLLNYLGSNDRQFEVKTYLLQKLRMISEKCPRFTALLKVCLSEKPAINNYHVIGQKGLTTALHRVLTKSPAFNESLLSIQEINQGVLKRGSVEMILGAGREQISTFKLGIYTSGLNSFVGESSSEEGVGDDEEEEDSPVTAGMEISVQGVLLRPLVFFNGQTELMGHVWSGTASEPTPAFLATTLVQDHEHYVMLSSGSTVYLQVLGAKSIDLNGQVQFSLWNRNAHTEINQIAGTGVVGSMVVGTSFAKLENKFSLTTEPKISLIADSDFYSDMKLCIQLGRPESSLWHQHNKSVILTDESPYSKKITSKVEHKLPGSTLALNQKNNEMCNMIFPS